MTYNSIRDTVAELLRDVCKDVETEPQLLPVPPTLQLPNGSNTGARLDVSARSFWSPLDRAFIDVRVPHPQAPSNSDKSIAQMYASHENLKKREYNQRVIDVEKATFTPFVMSTTGGLGTEATQFLKHLADKISHKKQQRYSDVIAFMRRRLRFDMLKTCLISIRGYRGSNTLRTPAPISEIDFNLVNPNYQ